MSAPTQITVTMAEAVNLTGISKDQLTKAIHATEGPRLRAKRNGQKYVIFYADLVAFTESLPDA